MYSFYGTSAGIVQVLECGVPCQCLGCRTGYAGDTGHAAGGAFTGEVLFEDAAVVILFFIHRGVDGKTFCGMCHLFVTDSRCGNLFQRIYPTIPHTVTELFFLAPGDAGREHIRKGFAQDFLFDDFSRSHFYFGIELHGHIQKLFVEERDTSFHTPCCEALIGAKAIV